MDFASSSQLARWTFTPTELQQRRALARTRALKTEKGTDEAVVEAPVTVKEEQQLLRYYEKTLIDFCTQRSYSRRLQPAALVYLKRFYIEHSVLSQDPSKLAVACLYVASKVEEEYLSLDSLVRAIPTVTESTLRKTELKLVKALNYDLIVHTPFKGIDGLIEDISRLIKKGEAESTGLESLTEVMSVRRSAIAAAQCLLETDAPLIYKPSRLALAAVRSGYRSHKKRLTVYLQTALGQSSDDAFQKLQEELSEIDRLGVEGAEQKVIQTETVRDIDRRLKVWLKRYQKTRATKESAQQQS